MAYVLDIRVPEEGGDGEALADSLRAGLAADGPVEEDAEGFGYREGGTRLRFVRTRDENGVVDGLDLEIPYGAVASEVSLAVDRVLGLVRERHYRVFDPQLGRAVGPGDAAAVVASFTSASSYHVEYGGRVEDARAGLEGPAEAPRTRSTQLKVVLAIAAILVVAYLGFQSCVVTPLEQRLAGPSDVAAEDGGPPPGWVTTHPTTLAPGSLKVRAAGDGGT